MNREIKTIKLARKYNCNVQDKVDIVNVIIKLKTKIM